MGRIRNVRVTTSPIAVRIADVHGRLINISATGALTQVNQALQPERECQMYFSVEWEPVMLRGRVIRSEAVAVHLSGATWQRKEFAVALAFTDIPPKAHEALKALCGDAFDKRE